MRKYLLAIFLLALILRVYHLGTVPIGFHIDEVKVGWNAWSIFKTGRDDRGNKFALYYNSFGDQRPTGIFYLTIPSLVVFGLNEFAVRFPSALLGAGTVPVLYLVAKEIEKRNKAKENSQIPLVAAFLLAVNPWHISVSRATSEVVVSNFLALIGVYFFLKALRKGRIHEFIYTFVSLGISYFFYHSIKLIAPIIIFSIIAFYWQSLKGSVKKFALLTLVALSLLTFAFTTGSQARGRFSQVSVFNDLDVQHELSRLPFEEGPNRVFIARLFHNKPSVWLRRFIVEYTKYFSPDFLIGENAKPDRYTTKGVGLLTYVELVLLIIGLVAIAKGKRSTLPLVLLLVAPLAAALTTEDTPNLHRSLFMALTIPVIGSYGFAELRRFKLLVATLLVLNFIFFLHMYFVHSKFKLSVSRNYGAKEMALKVVENQDKYDKILFTDIPDDPYPWIAFFGKKDPATFNKDAATRDKGTWTTENFTFTGLRCPSNYAFDEGGRVLAIDAVACTEENKLKGRTDILLEQIKREDESRGDVYNIWYTK